MLVSSPVKNWIEHSRSLCEERRQHGGNGTQMTDVRVLRQHGYDGIGSPRHAENKGDNQNRLGNLQKYRRKYPLVQLH